MSRSNTHKPVDNSKLTIAEQRTQELASRIFEDLNMLEAKFVQEYWETAGNATEAYYRAKGGDKGTVKRLSAATEGWKLLQKPYIQRAIKEYTALEANETFVLNNMRKLASSSEKDTDKIKATAKLGEFLNMGNKGNRQAGAGTTNIQVNIGLPSRKANIEGDVIDI